MKKDYSRKIPDEYLAFAEQAMLNMALRGTKIIVVTETGSQNIAPSLIAQAGRVNRDYQTALTKVREKKSMQTGRMSQASPQNSVPTVRGAFKPGPKPPKPLDQVHTEQEIAAGKAAAKKAARTRRRASSPAGAPNAV